jgi:hypothetical protein
VTIQIEQQTMPADIRITVRAASGVDATKAVRRGLKYLLRACKLRCIGIATTDDTTMSKLSLSCNHFRAFKRNTLHGFATIRIEQMKLTIRDVAVHQKNAARWAQLPAKPMVNQDGTALRDETGRIKYTPVLEFDGRAVRDAFSAAAIAAVLHHASSAFD